MAPGLHTLVPVHHVAAHPEHQEVQVHPAQDPGDPAPVVQEETSKKQKTGIK